MKLRTPFKVLSVSLALIGTHLPISPSGAANPPAQSAYVDTCGAPNNVPLSRAKARKLVKRIRKDLDAVEDQIRNVPFLDAVEAGTASIEQIAAVAAEEYSIVLSDANSFAQMADRWDSPQGSQLFSGLVAGEAVAFQLLLDFAATVGLDEQDLIAYEPRPKGQTYPSRVAWIASNADRASAAASFLVNFEVFGENMGRMRDALVNVYGFEPEEVGFFGLFADPIPGFEDDAIEVIAAGLREGACTRDVRRSARLLQAYELDFWQAVGEPPGSQLPVSWQPAP
ncbi:MAG TPA: hypothetical protein VLS89_06460 [Candidatus Nanopelagicales bacterium]|nr:hypothetical protein [Candidatus Nanopelagicales bacterium]